MLSYQLKNNETKNWCINKINYYLEIINKSDKCKSNYYLKNLKKDYENLKNIFINIDFLNNLIYLHITNV